MYISAVRYRCQPRTEPRADNGRNSAGTGGERSSCKAERRRRNRINLSGAERRKEMTTKTKRKKDKTVSPKNQKNRKVIAQPSYSSLNMEAPILAQSHG